MSELHRQQQWMWENKEVRIDDKIVSINQPHIRPIVREKGGKNTEFGSKLSASCIDGYVFLHRISWDNYNEPGDLKSQFEEFKNYTGHYPKSVHGFANLPNMRNRKFCKERGIRMSGSPLGRQPKNIDKEKKKQAQER